MAEAEFFPPTAMQDVVAELADWLPASELPTENMVVASVPLRIWELTAGSSLREAAEPTNEWHHQLHHNGRPFGFACSQLIDGRAQLTELAQSSLAEAVEDAFRALRGRSDDAFVLKMLRILKHQTSCLWLDSVNGAHELIVLQSRIWDRGLRVDEPVFFRMVDALPGTGLRLSSGPRRRDIEAWSAQRWTSSRTLPVRQAVGV